jgi:16S rRNA (cytosine1402-N4)-methyltransferase
MEKEIVRAFSEMARAPKKFLDGTLGRGGHTRAILSHFPASKVFGFDRDEEAISYVKKEFSSEISANRLEVFHDDFRHLRNYKLGKFDGALFDLGVSSPQFDEAERGFSFQKDGPLDMRMDRTQKVTAAMLVNESTEKELSDIFYNLGEVRHPNRVVRAIVHDRRETPFTGTRQLGSLIERVERARHKASVVAPYFMALRIAVNGELEELGEFFKTTYEFLEPQGRAAVISFHSLEDRIVKWAFKAIDKEHGHILTKKVIVPTDDEVESNSRSRSAKLRIFENGEQR